MDSPRNYTRARPKKNRPISLAQLNAGALDSATHAIARSASPTARSSISNSAPSSSAASLSETSLALCLHYSNLSDFLCVARSCRRWYDCCKGRLAWSGGRQWVCVNGSRDEMRELGSTSEEDKPQVRNFNPIGMHQTSTAELIRATSKTNTSASSAAATSSAPAAPTPLMRLCSTPLLLNVRHLSYRFASPLIRTSIADLDAYEMFATDVIAGRFPLCGLPNGALPFLASLALEDVTACSQLTLQSAFHSLGVQQHSYLRALKLVASPVLSATESARSLRAILEELPANLRNLQILHMPQRNLPEHLPIESMLGLHRLETLVLDASFAKTAPRLQVIRSLALNAQLKHLSWPSWRAAHLGMLCAGVGQEDAANVAALVDPNCTEMISFTQLQLDDAVVGLDDDEIAAPATASSAGSSSLNSASFGFASWTIDGDVRWSDFARFFSLSPSLFPALHTLSFVSPTNFASMVDHLPEALQSLPALTALRMQVAYYSLGAGFFTKLSACSLPRLRKLELDQISLVSVNHVASIRGVAGGEHRIELNPSDEADELGNDSGSLWSCFPALEDLSLLHMTLPRPQGLASSMPGLKRVCLEDVVSGGRGAISGTSPGMHEWIQEIAQLQQLQQLFVLHAPEVGVDAFAPLAACRSLELLSFCPLRGGSQSSSHTHLGRAASSVEWEHPSVRHFDMEDAAAPQAAKGMQRQSSSEARAQAAAARATSWAHTEFSALQRRQASSSSMSDASGAAFGVSMRVDWREENGTQRSLPSLRARH